jgi:hypothetical protein
MSNDFVYNLFNVPNGSAMLHLSVYVAINC